MSLLTSFPRERTWLLPSLHAVQRAEGWISPEAMDRIGAHLRVPRTEVWGVATHYPEFRLTPRGRRLVRVCTGVSCRLHDGLPILRECERALGVAAGQTAADGSVTLEELDCAFACAVAPVIEIDHHRHGRISVRDVAGLVSGETPSTASATDAGTRTIGRAPPAPTAGSPAARFAMIRRDAERHRTGARLAVGVGSCGAAVGAWDTVAALEEGSARRGLPFTVVAAGCNGMCWAAPTVEILRDGRPRLTASAVTPDRVPQFLDALAASTDLDAFAVTPDVLAAQRRVVLARCGMADPHDIADAIRHGTYAAFARALDDARPERVIEEVRAAGLRGRGGAYFETAVKWASCRAAGEEPKFVIVNGEEGEPGIFKDRHLMEGDPHRLLEGMLLAAFAVGARHAILYVHGEADLSATRLATALEQAREWGLVGEDVLGSGFTLDVEVRRGAGGFVLGEETALLESIEGRRAMPRTRPPFPVEAGLWGKPTVINNVETLCAVPSIVEHGGAWFAALGGGQGTKLFGLSGHVARPGVVEMEGGCTLGTLLHGVGGGSATGRAFRAAVVGGPSGSIVHPRQFDVPLAPRGAVNPGTGGVIALDAAASVRDAVRTLLAFNTRESCGKCTPCREGTARLSALVDAPLVEAKDGARVRELADIIRVASLCGLGQAAPFSVLSGLTEFPDDFARV